MDKSIPQLLRHKDFRASYDATLKKKTRHGQWTGIARQDGTPMHRWGKRFGKHGLPVRQLEWAKAYKPVGPGVVITSRSNNPRDVQIKNLIAAPEGYGRVLGWLHAQNNKELWKKCVKRGQLRFVPVERVRDRVGRDPLALTFRKLPNLHIERLEEEPKPVEGVTLREAQAMALTMDPRSWGKSGTRVRLRDGTLVQMDYEQIWDHPA